MTTPEIIPVLTAEIAWAERALIKATEAQGSDYGTVPIGLSDGIRTLSMRRLEE